MGLGKVNLKVTEKESLFDHCLFLIIKKLLSIIFFAQSETKCASSYL
jgi:hypothetical protein